MLAFGVKRSFLPKSTEESCGISVVTNEPFLSLDNGVYCPDLCAMSSTSSSQGITLSL